MNEITVGVLTISDRCASNEAVDESGPTLVRMIVDGIINSGRVIRTEVVPDSKEDIERVLKQWCNEGVDLVLTTGGTGVAERDVTPEATGAVLERSLPGIPLLMFERSVAATPLAALSRGVAGVRGKSLIVNFPGSKKASRECLEAVAKVIPHAVDLIKGRKKDVEKVHTDLKKKSLVVADCPALRDRQSPYPCFSVEEAQSALMKKAPQLTQEKTVSLEQAIGHVLSETVRASDHLPAFDVSLVDGYAIESNDCAVKTVVGVSNMGDCVPDVRVSQNTCVRVSTGAPIPLGADNVVKVEDTHSESLHNHFEESKIKILTFPKEDNVRKMGSDYRKGDLLLEAETFLCPAAVGLLAAAGVTSVKVFTKPKVAVMSTGNELVEAGVASAKGKVRDSNRMMLLSLLREEHFEAVDLGITPDNPDSLRDSLERGFLAADVVVTSGSMSMGERDYLKSVITADFKGDICFGRVKMKPGKPTAFGVVRFEGKVKFWFGLPGNPASAFVTSHLFLLPTLRKISRQLEPCPTRLNLELKLQGPLEDRPQYKRGILKRSSDSWALTGVASNQRSSWVGSCVNSNCLIVYPEQQEYKTYGDYSYILLIGKIK